MTRFLAGLALLPSLCPAAQAQIHSIDQTARFTLKPAFRLSLPGAAPASPPRPEQITLREARPTRAETAILFSVARRTMQFSQQRESGTRATASLAAHLSRTHVRTIRVEGMMPVDEHSSLLFGWSGAKYSNRNANVTAAYSNANLRAKDWFQPHAALHWAAWRGLLLRAAYDENLLAYADIGMSGPLGLTREDFRRFQSGLHPERHRRVRFDADWTTTPDLRLSLTLYGGRLEDRLTFAEGSALPINRGSADLQGGAITATHRVTPALGWSLRYSHARVDRLDGGSAQERQLAVEGIWETGPWRASLRAARTSRPALLLPGDQHERPVRLSAAISCQPPAVPNLTLGLRLADPDRLASSAFTTPAAPLGLRAQDQARVLLFSTNLVW
ncbi:hypothetical protein MOK15_16825 [Sphingobium sp. BYY-5]|uniref:hypothetical protein n=1 Tax=Sphingobium sp. BYY-5 TaxID=2926400 RepID=UPI001FA766E9|nr:hypothetical protein [Sphingobium sp. BYY-5]MCI4591750.1 hypothetical protein [Sphingobium sp. BYY-5]